MDNEMYEERARIVKRMKQIEDEYLTRWNGGMDNIGTKPKPPEVQEECERLSARLQELDKEEKKDWG